MALQNQMKVPTNLPETNIVSVHEAEVTGLVRIDVVELHIGGLVEGGHFVAHKPPREVTDLIISRSGRQDFHDVFHSKLKGKILEEVQNIVGVLEGGGDSILFPHFSSLGDEMPTILPLLCLCSKQFVVVQVNGG